MKNKAQDIKTITTASFDGLSTFTKHITDEVKGFYFTHPSDYDNCTTCLETKTKEKKVKK